MTLHRLLVCLSTAGAIAGPATPLAAQSALVLVPLRMADVMSPADLERAGLENLTREQRLALDSWLTRYAAELRRSAAGNGAAIDQPARWDASPRAGDQPGRGRWFRDRRIIAPITAPPGARLVATPDDGSYVRLADGTLWDVYLPDRPDVDAWRRGDYVIVSRAAAGVGEFDHLLVNASARSRAFARFVGLVAQRRR